MSGSSLVAVTPSRACEVCGGSLADRYANAKTCGARCRVAKHRLSKILRPSPELLTRYEAALPLVTTLTRPEQRLDLLAAVVWPESEQLRDAA